MEETQELPNYVPPPIIKNRATRNNPEKKQLYTQALNSRQKRNRNERRSSTETEDEERRKINMIKRSREDKVQIETRAIIHTNEHKENEKDEPIIIENIEEVINDNQIIDNLEDENENIDINEIVNRQLQQQRRRRKAL